MSSTSGLQGAVQSHIHSGIQSSVQSSGNKSVYTKQHPNSTYGIEYVSTSISSPYTSTVGSVPVVIHPTTTTPQTQFVTVANQHSVIPTSHYQLDGTTTQVGVTPILSAPSYMLSPTIMATSPQMNATYATYGIVPSQHLTYSSIASSPTNTSRPSRTSSGCC